MKKINRIVVVLGLVVGVGALLSPVTASAVNVYESCPAGVDTAICKNQGETIQPLIKTVINVLLYLIGAVSVIMIIIGGLKYTVSNGDASGVTSAKNTILYSVVGLVVAFTAYAIVNWVVAAFQPKPTTTSVPSSSTKTVNIQP